LYPANAVGDDIELYTDESRKTVAMTWYGLRQQVAREAEDDGSFLPNRCLADFVAPKSNTTDTVAVSPDDIRAGGLDLGFCQISLQIADYVGVFAVTTGLGVEKKEAQFLAAHDDYSAILFKGLADRLAEAFAECLHHKVRTDLWGYAPDEALSSQELITEKYTGIRPAPGYPACPDHSAKKDMFALLQCDEIGMTLTESLAMSPAASVSGFYLAHPQASYFNVGKIGDDQLQDMAARRGMEAKDLQRLLAPNL
jgi:5-methyltetrahydrofolate--homocysteine methyltransferase